MHCQPRPAPSSSSSQVGHLGEGGSVGGVLDAACEVADWEKFLDPHTVELHFHTVPRAFLFIKDEGEIIMLSKSKPISGEKWGTAQNFERIVMFPRGPPELRDLKRAAPREPRDWSQTKSSVCELWPGGATSLRSLGIGNSTRLLWKSAGLLSLVFHLQ